MTRRTIRGQVLAVLVLALTGCSPTAPSTGAAPLELLRFRAGSAPFSVQSDFTEPTHLVIRDQAAWDDAWARLGDAISPFPSPARPQVDFASHMIVLVALGVRPSGGYSVVIESAVTKDGDIVVTAREVSPGPGCFVTSNLTEPVDLARLPAVSGPVRFEIRQTPLDCS